MTRRVSPLRKRGINHPGWEGNSGKAPLVCNKKLRGKRIIKGTTASSVNNRRTKANITKQARKKRKGKTTAKEALGAGGAAVGPGAPASSSRRAPPWARERFQ
jgi:hypothetical protein